MAIYASLVDVRSSFPCRFQHSLNCCIWRQLVQPRAKIHPSQEMNGKKARGKNHERDRIDSLRRYTLSNPSSQSSNPSSWHSPLWSPSQLTVSTAVDGCQLEITGIKPSERHWPLIEIITKHGNIQKRRDDSPEHPVLKIRLSLLRGGHPRLASDRLNRRRIPGAALLPTQPLNILHKTHRLTTHPAHRRHLSEQ